MQRPDPGPEPARSIMTATFRFALLWILGSVVGMASALAPIASAFDGTGYVPVGVDSFYHARRILDAAANLQNFYQFDPAIHAPAGSLLTWPWGYDLLMSLLVRLGQMLFPAATPIAILDHIPVLAVPLAIALMLLLTARLRLSAPLQLLAVLAVALSPLTQWLFRIGMADHHGAEYLFAVGSLCALLKWLDSPSSRSSALTAAIVLGIAPAFQNGLFILQLPLAATLVMLRFSAVRLPPQATASFGIALIITTLAVAAPSTALRQGLFSYYYLSWFHVYVAGCTAIAAIASAYFPTGRRFDIALLGLCALLILPLVGQLLLGANYLRADLEHSYRIAEVQTLLEQLRGDGAYQVAAYYSWLFLLIPVVWLGSLWYALAIHRTPALTLLSMTAALGLAMLCMKFRLANFGSFAMIVVPLLAVDHWFGPAHPRRRIAVAATVLAFTAALTPCLAQLFTTRQWLGMNPSYALTHDIYPAMAAACARHPGIMLASNDDGHYIRYHSQCQVTADNFMLTPDDAASLKDMERLLSMSPKDLLQATPRVDYVFARLNLAIGLNDRGNPSVTDEESQKQMTSPLFNALIFSEPGAIDDHYRLLAELRWPAPNNKPYARLFQIVRDPK